MIRTMNRKFLIIVLVIGIAGIVLGYLFMNRKNITQPTAGSTIIFFGDSLISGTGATPGNDVVSVLEKRLGTPIVNAGRAGDTTKSALERLEEDVLSKHPRVVVVLLGGNDFLRRIPKTETLANIQTIVTNIQKSGAAVILVGVSRVVYDADYKKIAQKARVQYVPHILDETVRNKDLMADPIHPNNKGYVVFADKIEPYLKNLLATKKEN